MIFISKMAKIGTFLPWILFLLVVLVNQSDQCSFTPAYNQSLVDKVYHYFDEDSDVIIVEYVISLNVTSPYFDWSEYSDYESFQPWRWFRTQGSGNARILLAFYYYYGLFKNYLTFETVKVEVTLNPVPQGCVENIGKGELDELLRDYLLRDFDINPKAVRHPYTPSDDVSVCSMYLNDIDGWGRLTYRCCRYDDDDDSRQKKECDDVYNDGWVWALRALIIIFTIVLFLHLPSLIPGGHRLNTYEYSPSDNIHFNLVMTSHPNRFSNLRNAATLKFQEWKKMSAFKTEVDQLEPEVTYNAHVQRVDCHVHNDRMAHRNESPVSFTKSFFDAFVLCKIRHTRPVEECCHTSICGEMCCGGTCCPPWHSWLRALRVLILMSIVALPSLPLFYVVTADNLDYQDLDDAHKDRNLNTAFNVYPGKTFSRVAVGILSFMYVLNTIILVLDGATDGRLTKLYSNVLEVSKRNSSLRQKSKLAKVIVRKFFRPIQKYGVYLLPFWLVAMCFLPVALLIFYVIDSPMARILGHAVRKLLERMNVITKSDLETDEKFISFCKVFWFLISLIFVFIVITLGINLIVHVIAMIIVEIVVDARVVYQVLPVIFFLLFYIRDSFHRAGEKYKKYLDTVLRSLISKEEDELEKEIKKPWPLERNKMFQVSPGKFKKKLVDAGSSDTPAVEEDPPAAASAVADISGPGLRTPLFEVYRGALWIRLQRVVLLLSKEELVSTTRKFLFQACDMECYGIPGRLEENFIMACLDFLRIAVFLLFVFISVMAYGSIYSISPTNHLFITLATGLVPLVVRNVFKDKTEDEIVDITSFRYESQLDQTVQSFVQNWELRDIIIDSIKRKHEGSDVKNDQPVKSNLASTRMADYDQYTKRVILSTLVLDLNEDIPKATDSRQKRPRNTPKQRSTRVGNSSSFCCGVGGKGGGVADEVDSGNITRTRKDGSRYENSTYRAENETEKNLEMWTPDKESSKYQELSNMGKWKRKKKSRKSTLDEPSSPSRELRDMSGHEPSVQALEGHRASGSQNVPNTEVPAERPKVTRHSSRDFRRFTVPTASLYGGGQGHSDRQDAMTQNEIA